MTETRAFKFLGGAVTLEGLVLESPVTPRSEPQYLESVTDSDWINPGASEAVL